jgi:hypothetical protein
MIESFTYLPLGAFLGLGEGDAKLDAAIVGGLFALALLFLRAIGLVLTGQLARQRDLFSKAYEAAMAWSEMLYRLRRRARTEEADRQLVDRFHELQEKIDYYEGWAASEGRFIGKSYCRLVRDIKKATQGLIQEAWETPGRLPGEPVPANEIHPDLSEAQRRFLRDVRHQLSLFFLPRLCVLLRNLR